MNLSQHASSGKSDQTSDARPNVFLESLSQRELANPRMDRRGTRGRLGS